MKKNILISVIAVFVALISVTTALALNVGNAANSVASHQVSSEEYNENPTPIYTANETENANNFVSEDKCIANIAKTNTSKIITKELKTWGQHVTDDKEEAINYQIDSNRMVRVIKTEFPDGLDTKAGFYDNAVLTSVFDAETGNLIESHVTGDYQGKSVPATSETTTLPDSASLSSDSLNILTENTNFQNHGFEVKALTEAVKLDKTAAVKKANESVGKQISTKAESITAVSAKFTDTETPVLPESNITLKDYPVWIVTYHGVTLQKQGMAGGTVYADQNVVIDANSGEVLETFSYSIK